ncbi:MAG: transglycosylase SLT domain-containing protein [Thermovirgaceae bacterium]
MTGKVTTRRNLPILYKLREFAKAVLLGGLVCLVVGLVAGGSLSHSPSAVFARQAEARQRAIMFYAIDESVHSALEKTGLSAQKLFFWSREHPASNVRYLWGWERRDQKNVAVLALYITSQNKDIDPLVAWRQAVSFVHYSKKYDVPLDLAVAVANTESHFKPEARSGFGAMGVMQVAWHVHEHLLKANGIAAAEDLYDPEMGIAAGTLLLSRYLNHYGSTQRALERYYGGAVSRYWPKVSRYIAKVKSWGLKTEI